MNQIYQNQPSTNWDCMMKVLIFISTFEQTGFELLWYMEASIIVHDDYAYDFLWTMLDAGM